MNRSDAELLGDRGSSFSSRSCCRVSSRGTLHHTVRLRASQGSSRLGLRKAAETFSRSRLASTTPSSVARQTAHSWPVAVGHSTISQNLVSVLRDAYTEPVCEPKPDTKPYPPSSARPRWERRQPSVIALRPAAAHDG